MSLLRSCSGSFYGAAIKISLLRSCFLLQPFVGKAVFIIRWKRLNHRLALKRWRSNSAGKFMPMSGKRSVIRRPLTTWPKRLFSECREPWSKGPSRSIFRGWIFQIARNAIIDWTKERRRFVELEEEEKIGESVSPKETESIDSEFRQGLFAYAAKVIEGMPAEDREALTLTELDGFNREELANHLGISVSAAKSRVVRARAKLRKAIEDCCRLTTDPYGKVIGWRRRETDCCWKK